MSEKVRLTCFLVSPFGDKTHQLQEGKGGVGQYELIRASLKEIIEGYPDAEIQFKRADEILDVPNVAETFIGGLYGADIVVAELSATTNANVYYEIGIRYALKRGITIPIWQQGTDLPADLKGILGIEYDQKNPMADREKFYDFIRQRLNSRQADSPVYRVIPNLEMVDKEDLDKLRTQVADLEEILRKTAIDQSTQVLIDEGGKFLANENAHAALAKFKLAYAQAPNNLQLAIRYGKLLSRLKSHDGAIAVLRNANALAERSGNELSVAKRELGVAYSRANKPQLALEVLEQATSIDDTDADSFGIIGGIYKQKLELDKAIDAYERGFEVDGKSTYCLLNLIALVLIRNNTGDRIKAKKCLREADGLTNNAIAAKNADHWVQFDRAHYLLFAKSQKEALTAFQSALDATKTIGELDSARKNLDLLEECEASLPGLDQVIALFGVRAKRLSES